MDLCNKILTCFTGIDEPAVTSNYRTTKEVANDVVELLYKAEKNGKTLKKDLQDIVSENGWTENLGKAILDALEKAVKAGTPMGQAMKEAFEKATKEAYDFAREHPVYCTLIALGILVILAPWVIEALGFGADGPIAGTIAAAWQSRYAGYVPKGSLFSFFQRLGMTWKKIVLAPDHKILEEGH